MSIRVRAQAVWGLVGAVAIAMGVAAQAERALSADGEPPVAAASGHRLAVIGERITLDASASTDSDSERLSYRWTLEAPAGSGARLSNATSPRPFFEVDLVGDYRARLVVSDGKLDSAPAEVLISTQRKLPFARAAHAERVLGVGQVASFDAFDLLDPGSGPVRWRWQIERAPELSRAALVDRNARVATLAPDAPGTYVLGVRAENRRGESAKARFFVHTEGAVPKFDLPAERRATVGSTVQLAPTRLSVGASPVAYQWRLRHVPHGSRAQLERATAQRAQLHLDAPGLYVAQLLLKADALHSPVRTVVIEAVQPFLADGLPLASSPTAGLGPARGASDIDGDGVPDDIDNCVETPNPNQIDTNNDGFGNRCDPDLDNDGLITNTVDLGLLRLAFFSRPGDPNWNPDADFNSDGVVNVIELGILREFFFNAPGPIANEFINPAGGSWHDPANWSLGFIPNAAHAVRIDLTGGATVEFSTGNTQISSIRTTSPLIISGGTLNVTRLAEFNDTVTMSGSAVLENAPMIPPTINPSAAFEIAEFSSVRFEGVVLANDLTVLRGGNLIIENNLLLDGATVTLDGDGNTSRLRFEGFIGSTSVLGGNGTLRFGGVTTSNFSREVLVGTNMHNLRVEPGVTIDGGTAGGRLRTISNTGRITLQGAIDTGANGRVITATAAPLIVEGQVTSTNDGNVVLDSEGAGGLFAAAAIGTATMAEIEFNGEFLIEGSLSATDGVIDIGTTDAAPWDNDGAIGLNNSTVELGGSFGPADIGTITGTGVSVIDGVLQNAGLTTDLTALLPGAIELGTSGRAVGGALDGPTLSVREFQNFTLDGVTLAADIDVRRGGNLDVENGLTFDGAMIRLDGDGNTTRLRIEGAAGAVSMLDGTGEVSLTGATTSSFSREILIASSEHGAIFGPGVSVRSDTVGGRVRHQFNNAPVTFQGLLEADIAGSTVTLQGAPLRVEGDVSVSSDSRAVLDFAGSGGVFAASATAMVNTGELEFNGEFTIEGSITVTDGTLDLGTNGGALWDNNGTIVLNNGTLELGGGFSAASIGNITGTGTTIIDGTLDNVGQVIDLGALAPGTLELATPGRVVGGTVQGSTLTLQDFQSFTLEGVTLGSDVLVQRGGSLDIENGLTLNGATITLGGDGNVSRLRVEGPAAAVSTIGGTGQIRFGGTTTSSNSREVLVTSSQHGLLIGQNVTVGSDTTGGRVRHQSNNGPITLEGTLESNVAARTVSMSAAPLSVLGAVDVMSDGQATLIFQGSGGVFGTSAVGTVNTGELEFNGEFLIEGAITATDGVVDLGTTDGAPWDNDGTITLINGVVEAGGGFDAAAVGSVSGTGSSVIDGTLDNVGQTINLSTLLPGTLGLATPGRVAGGTVTGATLTLQEFQTFTLDGVTLAADIATERGSNLDIENGLTLANASITLGGDGNVSRLRVEGAAAAVSTIGGTGEIRFGGTTTSSFSREILIISSQHGLLLGPGVTVRTDTTGGRLRHQNNNGPATIEGPLVSDIASRSLLLSAAPLTLDGPVNVSSDATISATFQGSGGSFGASAVGTVNTGELEFEGEFTVEGTISVTDGVLDLGDGSTDNWTNNGTITLTNGTVELGGQIDATDVGAISGTGTSLINAVFDNTGQNLNVGALLPGTLELGTPGRLIGGTLSGAPLTVRDFQTFVLDGVTLAADISAARGASINVENGLTFASGNVNLDGDGNTSRLRVVGVVAGATTFGGTGEIRFAGTGTSFASREILVAPSQHTLTIGSGITVRSTGAGGRVRHQNNNATITVDGTVISDVPNRTIALQAVAANPVQINGILLVGAGSVLDLDDYVLAASASVDLQIGGTAVADFARLISNDDATLGGTLNVALINGFMPSPGDSFAIATFVNSTGTFDTENTAGLSIAYNASDVTLSAP